MRPMIRPGLAILRRDVRTLQLGLDWPGLAAIGQTPAITAVLDCVDGFKDAEGVVIAAASRLCSDSGLPNAGINASAAPAWPPASFRAAAETALAILISCGVIVDRSAEPRADVDGAAWAALWLLAGPTQTARDVAAMRAAKPIWVDGEGRVAATVRNLLAPAGLTMATSIDDASLVVLANDGEPPRRRSDAIMHTGLPHVWVYLRDLVGVVGPFVLPGKTACLRCVDAARSDLDRTWPTILTSVESRKRLVACDPVQATLIAAWVTQEVAAWASELVPETTRSVIEIPQVWGQVDVSGYEPHPHCGCGWPIWHDTIGA